MCRAKDKENRRCGCDTNEARRLRYGVNIAKRMWNSMVNRPPKPNFLESPKDVALFTIENIKQEISSLQTFEDPSSATNAALIWHDRKLNTIGAGVEHLAATKYGAPSDEQLVEAEKTVRVALELAQDEIDAKYEKYKLELLESGKNELESDEEAITRAIQDNLPESYGKFCSLIEIRNEAYRKSLVDVGVEFATPESFLTSEDSDKETLDSVRKAVTFYPQSWVDLSNEDQKDGGVPLQVTKSSGRGYYLEEYQDDDTKIKAELSIAAYENPYVGDERTSNAIHELAHRVSVFVPSIELSEKTFLARRTGQIALPRPDGSIPKPEKLSWMDTAKTEKGYRDNFPVHYMGRVYEGGCGSEIFSTGMDSLFTGQLGGLSGIDEYSADPDYRKFILGLLASSAKS